MKFPLDNMAFHQGQYCHLKEANVNIATHALQYGTMVIGGIRGYYNQKQDQLYLFRLEDHILRLLRSAHIMQMKSGYTAKEISNITIELVRKNKKKENIYLRPFIYKSALELSPRLHDVSDNFSMYMIPLEDYLCTASGLSLGVSSWRRIDENMVPARVKSSGAYINSALAKSEAIQNGFDEAIFLNTAGFVCEGSAENIFIVRDDTLITPPISSNVLEGITRKTIIRLAKDLSIPIVEREVARGELYIAEEVFLCGTGAQVAWVNKIDHRVIGDNQLGPITKMIRDLFIGVVTGEEKKYSSWLQDIYT